MHLRGKEGNSCFPALGHTQGLELGGCNQHATYILYLGCQALNPRANGVLVHKGATRERQQTQMVIITSIHVLRLNEHQKS
jgi:hypothetical protein